MKCTTSPPQGVAAQKRVLLLPESARREQCRVSTDTFDGWAICALEQPKMMREATVWVRAVAISAADA